MQYQAAIDAVLERLRKDLPRNLFYHSVEHTLDVLDRATTLALAEGVNPEDGQLLRVAAAYHDAGFLINNRDHERHGCRIVRQNLPGFGFDANAIERICGLIRATKIPQTPRNHLEEILCDADLDYLGRPDFYPIGQRLFQELVAYKLLETEAEWNRLQLNFLSSHQYWTPTNRRERSRAKADHLAKLAAQWGQPSDQPPN